jgi:hypothetical protein
VVRVALRDQAARAVASPGVAEVDMSFHPAQQKNNPRVPFRQVLSAETVHGEAIGARFFAVIIDPETQKPINKVPIFDCDPGEVVELSVERQTLFENSK